MGVQRNENALEETAQILYQYANMIKNGADSDTAMMAAAETLKQARNGQAPDMAAGPNPQMQAMATPNGPAGGFQPPMTPQV
jgi:hypothetical protein